MMNLWKWKIKTIKVLVKWSDCIRGSTQQNTSRVTRKTNEHLRKLNKSDRDCIWNINPIFPTRINVAFTPNPKCKRCIQIYHFFIHKWNEQEHQWFYCKLFFQLFVFPQSQPLPLLFFAFTASSLCGLSGGMHLWRFGETGSDGRPRPGPESGYWGLSNWDVSLLAESANPSHVLSSQKVVSH